jgi:hypothetical protein
MALYPRRQLSRVLKRIIVPMNKDVTEGIMEQFMILFFTKC